MKFLKILSKNKLSILLKLTFIKQTIRRPLRKRETCNLYNKYNDVIVYNVPHDKEI